MFIKKQANWILLSFTFFCFMHCLAALPIRATKRQPSFAAHKNLLQFNPLEDVVDPATDMGGDDSVQAFAQELRKTLAEAKEKQTTSKGEDDDLTDSSSPDDKETDYEEDDEKEVIKDDELPVVVQGLEKIVGGVDL
ncbi:hypothetical protein BDF20DRAFT_998584 [Mycotypha africana]|uniref:uncharacterized protein n=1 Tax=Mycotypha africana TaxID=64632 RepID=UPI002301A087|nr:uncharacterized protein BDF20DRAFT_998584 [Mycotypha africana]KAI8988063.1 hypothetical protein BDF20DRAFT_998584 [Mycotypha africana]